MKKLVPPHFINVKHFGFSSTMVNSKNPHIMKNVKFSHPCVLKGAKVDFLRKVNEESFAGFKIQLVAFMCVGEYSHFAIQGSVCTEMSVFNKKKCSFAAVMNALYALFQHHQGLILWIFRHPPHSLHLFNLFNVDCIVGLFALHKQTFFTAFIWPPFVKKFKECLKMCVPYYWGSQRVLI